MAKSKGWWYSTDLLVLWSASLLVACWENNDFEEFSCLHFVEFELTFSFFFGAWAISRRLLRNKKKCFIWMLEELVVDFCIKGLEKVIFMFITRKMLIALKALKTI